MNTNLPIETRKQHALDKAQSGDFTGAISIIQSVLQETPRDIGALLLLGDVQHAAGLSQDASRAYGALLQVAGAFGGQLPQSLESAVRRAQTRLGEYTRDYEAFVEQTVPQQERSQRFDQSVDILLGKKQIFVQQPSKYYFPGLPQI